MGEGFNPSEILWKHIIGFTEMSAYFSFQLAEFYQNDKNLPENSSGVHSDMEFDSNHNQLNGED